MVDEQGREPEVAPERPEPEEVAAEGEAAGDEEVLAGSGESRSAQASAQAREWVAQLQTMIDKVAHASAPAARQVAAKAAELAAVAGDKAGPFAMRAAEKTGDVGTRVAERSRRIAADLRAAEATADAEPTDEAGAPAPEEDHGA
jgi:hypothetical protein